VEKPRTHWHLNQSSLDPFRSLWFLLRHIDDDCPKRTISRSISTINGDGISAADTFREIFGSQIHRQFAVMIQSGVVLSPARSPVRRCSRKQSGKRAQDRNCQSPTRRPQLGPFGGLAARAHLDSPCSELIAGAGCIRHCQGSRAGAGVARRVRCHHGYHIAAYPDQGSGRETLSDDQLNHSGAVVGNDCEGNDIRTAPENSH
jgi:hypothetical protein